MIYGFYLFLASGVRLNSKLDTARDNTILLYTAKSLVSSPSITSLVTRLISFSIAFVKFTNGLIDQRYEQRANPL